MFYTPGYGLSDIIIISAFQGISSTMLLWVHLVIRNEIPKDLFRGMVILFTLSPKVWILKSSLQEPSRCLNSMLLLHLVTSFPGVNKNRIQIGNPRRSILKCMFCFLVSMWRESVIWIVDNSIYSTPLVLHFPNGQHSFAFHCISIWFAFGEGNHGLILGSRHLALNRSLVWLVSRRNYVRVNCLFFQMISLWRGSFRTQQNAPFKGGLVQLLLARSY